MPRLLQFSIVFLLGLLTALPSFATGNLVSLEVIDRVSGGPLPVYHARGQDFIAGQPGSRYAVRMVNRTAGRVLVVLSVDGINAITGNTAAPEQSGYVLDPYASAEITGWRKNMSETAAFYFTSLADSYAGRTDRPDNVGVIGLAVFTERVRYVPQSPTPSALNEWSDKAKSMAPAPAASARDSARAPAPEKAEPRLGTGHGEREYAPTEYTQFERASTQVNEIVRLRYDSRAKLIAQGIIPRQRPVVSYAPDPFPGFVPDPIR